jgi:hypothetical protein
MINMCIICIDESTIVETTLSSQAAGTTRSISTDPTRTEASISQNIRDESNHSSSSSDDQQEPAEQSNSNDNASEISLPPTRVDLSRDISHLVVPRWDFFWLTLLTIMMLDFKDVFLS